jgi:hypothetical protein
MLGGIVSLCSLAICLRTISEYRKRSPQMRQCHWSRAKMYGRHSELFGSSLGSGILIPMPLGHGVHSRVSACQGEPHAQSETARVCHAARCGGWHPFEATKSRLRLTAGACAVASPAQSREPSTHEVCGRVIRGYFNYHTVPGSIARLIRTSMSRNAKQINAPVGAEVFSLAQQQFEKYGLRASNKPSDFNYIKNPYQIPVVHRSREKPRRENTDDAVCRFGSAELRRESPAKRGDFHVVASQERKLATTRLAERVGFEPTIRFQLCRLFQWLVGSGALTATSRWRSAGAWVPCV